MDLILKPTKRAGFYVDAQGNNYLMDGDWFIPLYPHKIHRKNVSVWSMNGGGTHNTKNRIRSESTQPKRSNHTEPVNACDLGSGG